MMKSSAKFYFQILTTSGVPIYRQIIDQVKTQIAVGHLQPGDYLPSVRQVAAELEVNPMTVSKAYSLLEKEGVLEAIRGTGMQVRAKGTSEKDFKKRQETITPLLKEVVMQAKQLSLEPKQVTEALEHLWKETKL